MLYVNLTQTDFTKAVRQAHDHLVPLVIPSDFQSQKQALLDILNKFIAAYEKPSDHKIDEIVNQSRKYMREQILEKETSAAKRLCDFAFELQLLLANHYPTNKNGDGEVECPISKDAIVPDNKIPTSSGTIYDKTCLNDYFSRNLAYQLNTNGGIQITGPIREAYSERETAYLRASGINIREPDENLRSNIGISRILSALSNTSGDRIEQDHAGHSERSFISRCLSYLLSLGAQRPTLSSIGTAVFGVSLLIGGLVSTALRLLVVFILPFYVLSPSLIVTAGLLFGFTPDPRAPEMSRASHIVRALPSISLISMAISSFGIGAVSLAKTTAILSPAALNAVYTTVSQLLPYIPLAITSIALISNYFYPEVTRKFFSTLLNTCSNLVWATITIGCIASAGLLICIATIAIESLKAMMNLFVARPAADNDQNTSNTLSTPRLPDPSNHYINQQLGIGQEPPSVTATATVASEAATSTGHHTSTLYYNPASTITESAATNSMVVGTEMAHTAF